jgi:hypothetical protein
MRPAMKRRLATLAAAVSLLLCIATVVLWVRSYRVADTVIWGTRKQMWEVALLPGEIRFAVADCAGGSLRHLDHIPSDRVLWSRLFQHVRTTLGVGSVTFTIPVLQGAFPGARPTDESVSSDVRMRILAVRFALPASAFALFPLWYCIRWTTVRHRHRAGLCLACGYDLRATPARCPECGAVPAASAAR